MILSNFIKVMSEPLNTRKPATTAGMNKNYNLASNSITYTRFDDYTDNSTVPATIVISALGIALSSDTSVPTVGDYKFTNFYTGDDLTNIDVSLSEGPMQTILTQTVRNDSAENVVINSVGVFGKYNTNIKTEVVLLTKTLLDTPVTVAPGEVKTITVTIDFNSFVENVNA